MGKVRVATNEKEIQQKLSALLVDLGKGSSLTKSVLSLAIQQNYNYALRELETFVELKADFPLLKSSVARYVEHIHDITEAIKSKRNLPGIENLSMGKRQEIYEGVIEHYREMKRTLKQVERIDRNMRAEDLRSTTIFVKTFTSCTLLLILLTFLLEFYDGLARTAWVVAVSLVDQGANLFFGMIGV